ncbi:MAG: hypothetical protein OM95_05990 [Bdellovibrio sp. ArHS]|uniref:transposase n=1 Tax=Bdellovibrio sp. ArHS TaxID=1569284 RepID=UPI000582FF69|nr:transposase [Bdellovibrio sp. ArHS]KHD89008.1 MAG: hypothetical protein OM95_05990 [Bdellovibrio sp. ArHS]
MSKYLSYASETHKMEIHSFVLMNNHFHLIAQFPENNMAEAMNYFMRETSRVISRKAGRINQTYGGRYFRSAITKNNYLDHVYKYVYRNPVEAGIVESVQDYQFSTLYMKLKSRSSGFPIIEDPRISSTQRHSTLKWLNTAPKASDKEEIRKALKKPEFNLTSRASGMFVHHLEVDRF